MDCDKYLIFNLLNSIPKLDLIWAIKLDYDASCMWAEWFCTTDTKLKTIAVYSKHNVNIQVPSREKLVVEKLCFILIA